MLYLICVLSFLNLILLSACLLDNMALKKIIKVTLYPKVEEILHDTDAIQKNIGA